MIQTETPYWQPLPAVPSPFVANSTLHDPTYPSGVTSAWAFRIATSSNVHAYGVNLYSFFNVSLNTFSLRTNFIVSNLLYHPKNYGQDCLNTYNCQQGIFQVDSASSSIYIYNLNTYVYSQAFTALTMRSRMRSYSIASNYMVYVDSTGAVPYQPNLNGFTSTVAQWKSSS